MSDQMSETEDATQFLTWNEFLAALGMPPALRELSERQMRYGICSEPDCEQAIDGWCAGCGAKLCAECLIAHEAQHYDESDMAREDYDECWPDGEPASSEQRSGGDGA